MQQVGETSQAIVEDDEREIDKILKTNSSHREPYWIVIYAKPTRSMVDGKHTMLRYRKAVFHKPNPQVGMIIAEVNNQTGTINWDISMPDRPFDYGFLGLEQDSHVKVSSKINPQAYIYN